MTKPNSRGQAWLAAGIVWGLLFGVVHLAWAAGNRFGLVESAAADEAFEQLWFRMYNVVVAVGSFVVAAAAALLHRRGVRGRMVKSARAVLWSAAVLLLFRGAVGAGQLLWLSFFSTTTDPLLAWSVDLYMLLGGVIFLLAALRSRVGPTPN